MEVVQTKPQSVLMIKLDVFEDHRGECMDNGIHLSFCINFNKLPVLDIIVFLCIAYFVRKLGRINPNAYFINFVKYYVII